MTEEITNVIYDTLMQNKQHPQLDMDIVESQEVLAGDGKIWFDYNDKTVEIFVRVSKR